MGNIQRGEVVDLNNELYRNIGYAVVMCLKYIFLPIGVAVTARVIVDKLLQPQSERQRKKRPYKNRSK